MNDYTQIKYKVDDDKWYRYKGVKPPERQSHGVSEDNINDLITTQNDHKHKWRQKGNFIFCDEGQNEHGKNVGVWQRLQGTADDGSPVLVEI